MVRPIVLEAEKMLNSTEAPTGYARQRRTWLAAGSLLGTALASACCILPLALVTLGVSGAWIGSLAALEPYRPYTAAVTLVLIGLGFRQVYFNTQAACEPGTYCARPESSVISKVALWFATALVILALTIDWWAPLFY
jgi:mercuric ion transport protein